MDVLKRMDDEIKALSDRLGELMAAKRVIGSLGADQPRAAPVKRATPAKRKTVAKNKAKSPVKGSFGAAFAGGEGSTEPTIREKIMMMLKKAEAPMTTHEIIAVSGDNHRKGSIYSTLSTMTKKAEVIRTGDNKYGLPGHPQHEAPAATH